MYESDNDDNTTLEDTCDLGDIEDESARPDYSIGVILTYKAQVELLKKMIEETRKEIRAALKKIQVSQQEDDELPEEQIGTFKAGEGKWGSCIRIVDPSSLNTVGEFCVCFL